MGEEGLSKTRKKVQEAVDKAEAEHRHQLLVRRIELANRGLKAYGQNKPVEAVKAFQSYLRILEDWKGVSEGGLSPSLFDVKTDAAELLLLSGVYWDLVRIYDSTKNEAKKREFLHYLEKYVVFSKGMRHQFLCAETMRKYFSSRRCQHVEEIKQAYKLIAINKCFIATELCDVVAADTVPVLRKFRDESLSKVQWGRYCITQYERLAPRISESLEDRSRFERKAVASILDVLAKAVAWFQ